MKNSVKPHLISSLFILVGLLIGTILSLQIRANPIATGSFPLEELENQKSLLAQFSLEQEDLKKNLKNLQEKRLKLQSIIESRSSEETQRTLESLKKMTGFDQITSEGVRITLNDHARASRIDFSTVDENFVQSTHLRDVVNALYLKGARAISINKKRILPLTPIQSAFDSILVDNVQLLPPFVVEAVGNPEALREAVTIFKNTRIQVYIDSPQLITILPSETARPIKYMSTP